jgi:hypothetical protein
VGQLSSRRISEKEKRRVDVAGHHQWLTPVILATQEDGSQPPGKEFTSSYLKNTQHIKRLVECLKW